MWRLGLRHYPGNKGAWLREPVSGRLGMSGHRLRTAPSGTGPKVGDLRAFQVTSGSASVAGVVMGPRPAKQETKRPRGTLIPEEPASFQSRRPQKPFDGMGLGRSAGLDGRRADCSKACNGGVTGCVPLAAERRGPSEPCGFRSTMPVRPCRPCRELASPCGVGARFGGLLLLGPASLGCSGANA
jgi:hypothetical protein